MNDNHKSVNEAFENFKEKIFAEGITPEEENRLIDELCRDVIVSHIATGIYPVFTEQITESYFKSVLFAVLTYNDTDNKPLIKITPYSFYKLFLELSGEKHSVPTELYKKLQSPNSIHEYSIDLFVRAVIKLYPDSRFAPFIQEEQQRIRIFKEYAVNSNLLALGVIIDILSEFRKDYDASLPMFDDIVEELVDDLVEGYGDTAVKE